MKNLSTQIIDCLQDMKGSGKFASVGAVPFVLPGLSIDKNEEINFPISQSQAKKLIKFAEQAPFGMGSETIVDTSVRNTWEIDAKHIKFNNPQWTNSLDDVLGEVKQELGLTGYSIQANLYKLLIYEKGGFFLSHKDSEKEKGMFGTLIIDLPSKFTGGELNITFENEIVTADFAKANPYNINFAAFYADCNHEVEKVTSGYRVCLVYNLIQKKNNSKIKLSSVKKHAEELAEIINNNKSDKPYIVLLEHQYTPTNFSYENLKLDDRLKSEVLLKAAEKLGFYSKLCLVTSYKGGTPYYDGYSDEPDDEMDEVFDESLGIEHWVESKVPNLNNLHFEEKDLISTFEIEEDEPIVKEVTDYMGNYGPEVYYWYHYGAVVIWSPEVNAALLKEQNIETNLDWINYFIVSGEYSNSEKKAVNEFITKGIANSRYYKKVKFNALIDWVIRQKSENLILDLNKQTVQTYFIDTEANKLFDFFEYLPNDSKNKWLDKVLDEASIEIAEKFIALINIVPTNEKWSASKLKWIEKLPVLIEKSYNESKKSVGKTTFENLFNLEKQLDLKEDWPEQMAKSLFCNATRKTVHKIVEQQLLKTKNSSELRTKIKDLCVEFLKKQVENKPLPPENWTRELPDTKGYKQTINLLKEFMASPTQQVFDYKQLLARRRAMEEAVRSVKIDVKMETIRKGSPHTLRITKTKASYENKFNKWKEDVTLLEKLKVATLR